MKTAPGNKGRQGRRIFENPQESDNTREFVGFVGRYPAGLLAVFALALPVLEVLQLFGRDVFIIAKLLARHAGFARAFPALDSFVAPAWNPPDKERIMTYLEHAPFTITQAPNVTCLICDCDLGNGSKNHSDGVWVWPSDLGHYVREHGVALPTEFVEHIRAKNYELPAQSAVDWAKLDWPVQK